MRIALHPHARQRMAERGATEQEIISAVESSERFQAKFGRTGFRRNFAFGAEWLGRRYSTKQVEAYAVKRRGSGWLSRFR